MPTPDTACCVSVSVSVSVNGLMVEVAAGASVVAALVACDTWCTRRSASGEERFALCGIGLCQECRVAVDGKAHQLACRTMCRDGMSIVTGGR